MANKRIQDLEQTADLTNNDLIPLDTTKKTFATTLKSLTEWLKNTFQTKDNLEQALSDATDKYPSSKVLKDESSRIVSVMDNQYSNLLSTLYPVGSIYIGTQNSCPLATLIAGSQWQIVATQVVTNVNTGVAVYGNGKTLGLTDNNKNYGVMSRNVSGVYGFVFATTNATNNNNGTSVSDNGTANRNVCLGVVRDAATSGLTGSLSRTNLSLNIWKRTA